MNMEYRRFGNTVVLRLDRGDEIYSCVLETAKKENIRLGTVSGIGAAHDTTVGIFDIEKGAYDRVRITGNHEITSLTGNINTMNGEIYAHMHITLAGEMGQVRGGHLLNADISLTAEIFITEIPAENGGVDRKHDDELNINTFSFTGD